MGDGVVAPRMVHATWGDWFVTDEVEAADPDALTVWYLGCNGFVVRSPAVTLYVDPYFADGNPPEIVRMIPVPMDPADASLCDAVFVTHEHIDHFHSPSYGPLLAAERGTLYAPAASYERPDYAGAMEVPADRRATVAPGGGVEIGDLTVHVRGATDPDAIEPVSYVIEHESGTFFHGGDSRPADAFAAVGREFDVDVGALALGSVGRIYDADRGTAEPTRWYNDENQVIEAARALSLDRLVPTHYDMWRGVGADPTALHEHAASYRYPRTVQPVRIGDRLRVDEPGIVPARVLAEN